MTNQRIIRKYTLNTDNIKFTYCGECCTPRDTNVSMTFLLINEMNMKLSGFTGKDKRAEHEMQG